ncbi:M949_RS01915 family surface polysaccharide biosynthesis protein [Longitalea luteola]|uniref:M949_RS01915 family surface polysaccharide biosynthesis protein n=1 Tax=Longitalea luteola TaxID=2812563 RepID=UPI001A9752BA|nr:hypothetical protein [Longitalea luteola]
MKHQLLIIILLTTLLSCTASPDEKPVPLLDFHAGMISKKLYKGHIKEGKRWKDKRGENIVILTQTGVYWSSVYDATRGARLYAYHFIKTGDSFKEVWKISEVVNECAWDVRCNFFSNSLTITDLDSDDIAEVGFALAKGCKSEPGPDEKKVVFYEGKDLYLIQGTTTVVKGSQKLGGDKEVEKKFADAPDAFLEFANKQWNKFGVAAAAK